MIAKTLGNKGEVAILSAASTMTNQNSWIEAMKEEWKKPEYKDMPLVATVYGDDQDDKSYREMQGLVKSYPNLRGVISPTTIGIRAGANARIMPSVPTWRPSLSNSAASSVVVNEVPGSVTLSIRSPRHPAPP